MATAWLIRRFVDRDATFAFVEAASSPGVPFDMYTGELSHHRERCTSKVLADRFRVENPAVTKLAHTVHDLDIKNQLRPAGGGSDWTDNGRFTALHADDVTLLEHGIGMFEALARSFESDQGAIRRPGSGRRWRQRGPRGWRLADASEGDATKRVK